MNSEKTGWVLIGAAAAIGLVILPIAVEPVRLLYAVVFCLLAPGAGWAYQSRVGDAADRLALAVMISMSVTICLATAMVATNTWTVPRALAVLTAISVLGFVPYRRARRAEGTSRVTTGRHGLGRRAPSRPVAHTSGTGRGRVTRNHVVGPAGSVDRPAD